MTNKDNVKATMDRVVEAFENGDALEYVAIAALPGDSPSARWSFSNRMIMLMHGTADARGFHQWKEVNRKVKKGGHAFYILAPRMVKDTVVDEETGETREQSHLLGFLGVPVFAVEETEGEELPPLEPAAPPPLIEVAERWGLAVKYGGCAGRGSYNPATGTINLATHDELTFYHELAHAAHHRVEGSIKGGQRWDQECIAEFCAAVIGRIYNPECKIGFQYKYITAYAQRAGCSAASACLKLMSIADKVLAAIFAEQNEIEAECAAS